MKYIYRERELSNSSFKNYPILIKKNKKNKIVLEAILLLNFVGYPTHALEQSCSHETFYTS